MARPKPLCVHGSLKSAPSVCTFVCTEQAGRVLTMQGKINKSAVEKLQPGELLADTEVKGFVARCLPSGAVT